MINKIAKIASITLVLIMALTLIIGCKTIEPEEEAIVETKEEAPAETTEEEVTEEEVEEEAEAEAEEPETITITDSSGREITINKPIEKIVCGHLTVAEALRIAGAWDRVVGRDGFISDTILYPNLDELPAISQPMNPYDVNFEKVFELHPDIFLTAYFPMPGFDDMVAKLEPEIPVFALNFYEPETIAENFRMLGLILGQEEEVEEFIKFYEEVEADISEATSKISDENKPRMFYKVEMGNVADLMTYTDEMAVSSYGSELTGSINIAADLPSQGGVVYAVDPEWLVEQDPDFVICFHPVPGIFGLDVDDTSAAETVRNEIMELDVFSGGNAVKNGDVYLILPDFLAMRYMVGCAYMAKWFHPDLFSDLDPEAIHQEYLTRFIRIDYDLEKHGVLVYPEQ